MTHRIGSALLTARQLDLKATRASRPDRHAFVCPACGSVLTLAREWFCCEDLTCGWLAGDGVALVRQVRKVTTGEAIRWIAQNQPDHFRHLPSITILRRFDEMAKQYDLLDDLFRWLIGTGGPGRAPTLEASALDGWLRGRGLDPILTEGLWLRFGTNQMAELLGRLRGLDLKTNGCPTGPALVMPTYGLDRLLAGVLIWWGRAGRERHFDLKPQAVQVGGLGVGFGDRSSRVILCSSPSQALDLQERYRTLRPDLTFLPARVNPSVLTSPQHHEPLCWAANVEAEDPVVWHHLTRSVRGVRFCHVVDMLGGDGRTKLQSFVPFLTTALLRHGTGQDGRLTERMRTGLTELSLSRQDLAAIRQQLRLEGRVTLAEDLSTLSSERVLQRSEQGVLVETQDSYELRGKSSTELLCNFTMEPVGTVVFGQEASLSYEMLLHFGERQYETLVSRQSLEVPVQLEGALQTCVLRRDQQDRPDQIPMVLNRSQYRHLVQHWKEHLSKLPVRQGIEHLGWSRDRHVFWTPYGRIDQDGVHAWQQARWHPDVDLFRHYHAPEPQAPDLTQPLPFWARNLWRLLLAGVARQRHNRPIGATSWKQTQVVQSALERFFVPLGQTGGIQKINSVEVVAKLSGYPAYGFCGSTTLASQLNSNLMVLSPDGIDPPGGQMEDLDWKQLGWRFRHDLEQAVLWLLSQPDTQFPTYRHVLETSQLLHEGNWLANQMSQDEWVMPELPYGALESHLDQIRHKIRDYVRVSPSSGKISLWVGDRMDVLTQVQSLVTGPVRHQGEWAEAEAGQLGQALRQYYGGLPDLTLY